MALFLVAGYSINTVCLGNLSVPQVLADFHEWICWRLMPGW
jgi:hypothetical protein